MNIEKLLTNKDKSSTKKNKKSSTIEKLILEKINKFKC